MNNDLYDGPVEDEGDTFRFADPWEQITHAAQQCERDNIVVEEAGEWLRILRGPFEVCVHFYPGGDHVSILHWWIDYDTCAMLRTDSDWIDLDDPNFVARFRAEVEREVDESEWIKD